MKKTKFLKALVLPIALVGLASCAQESTNSSSKESSVASSTDSKTSSVSSSSKSSTSEEVHTIKISVTGDAKVKVGKTLQLTATVTGITNKAVTWTSLSMENATVSETGLVTGLKTGKATIKATLTADDKCSDTIEITIEDADPETLTISGYESTTAWLGDTLQLAAAIAPTAAPSTVTWTTSAADIATVTDAGLVTFLAAGTVSISAASTVKADIKQTVEFTVKDTIVETDYKADQMDYSNVKQDNPVIRTQTTLGVGTNAFAHFKNIEGKIYMASATANISATNGSDTWSRISIGHTKRASNSNFHGWCLSPGPNIGDARKQVSMTINSSGSVQWGNITNNSQVWGSKLQKAVNFASVKLTSIRNGSDYYYFVNDEFVWKENNLFTDFNEDNTIPTIHAASAQVEFSALSATTDTASITTYLSEHSGNGKMYAYNDGVTINATGTQIDFTNTEATTVKENYAGTIGDAFILPANKQAIVEYDVMFNEFGSENAMVALTWWNNGKANGDCRSACLGYQAWGATGWDHNSNFPGIGAKADLSTPLTVNTVYHVKVTRLMLDNSQDMSIAINGISDGWTWNWTNEGDASKGDCQIRFGAQLCDVTISNITVTVLE